MRCSRIYLLGRYLLFRTENAVSELRKTEIVSFSKYRLDSEIERVDMWFIVV